MKKNYECELLGHHANQHCNYNIFDVETSKFEFNNISFDGQSLSLFKRVIDIFCQFDLQVDKICSTSIHQLCKFDTWRHRYKIDVKLNPSS